MFVSIWAESWLNMDHVKNIVKETILKHAEESS
jgi:hypothetical protein